MIQRLEKKASERDRHFENPWNELWDRSGDASPLARLETLVDFGDAFDKSDLRRLQVSVSGTIAAGMVLVPQKRWGVFSYWAAPNNPWVQCGGLLADHRLWSPDISNELARQMMALPGSCVCLDWMVVSEEWQQVCSDLRAWGCRVERQLQFETGVILTDGDWDVFWAQRSKGFRKKINSRLRQLNAIGKVNFERHINFSNTPDLERCIETALQLEHMGWKGEQQTSLNSNPCIRDFFTRSLKDLAAQGMLEIQFLKLDDRAIAFEIGFRSHGTYYSYKIGFDPEFSKFSPGQIITYFQLQHWFSSDEIQRVDTVGELSQATSKWCDETVRRYRYVIATQMGSRGALALWGQVKPVLKRLLKR
ncbi:MAG: GNAT family N-acetyltransferase [Pirellulaceae bacterium]|nr:GNAT family N-acetyltransferase [Pirellulaceae bacterium]